MPYYEPEEIICSRELPSNVARFPHDTLSQLLEDLIRSIEITSIPVEVKNEKDVYDGDL